MPVSLIPNSGFTSNPLYGSRVTAPFPDMRPRDVLAENFINLMKATPAYSKFPAITRKGGGANGTLDRIRRAEAAIGIDNLEPLAQVFGLQAWQLLVPGLVLETGTPDKPKVLGPPAWPFSRELLNAIQDLDSDKKLQLERVMRAHLDMDKDTATALSYDDSKVTAISGISQETPPTPALDTYDKRGSSGVKKDGRSKAIRPPGGRS